MRDAIPQVPSGIATLTDRVLPNLFPNPDRNVFAQTLAQAVMIEQPPPQTSNPVATTLGALGALGTQNFFAPSAKRRVLVVLTDGENAPNPNPPFDPAGIAKDFAAGPGVRLVLVQLWSSQEQVYAANGAPETGYHLHPESARTMSTLAKATRGRSFGESSLGGAARAVQAAAGRGPTKVEGRTERTQTLASYIALLALLPLLLVLRHSVSHALGSALRLFLTEELRRAVASSQKVRERRRRLWPTPTGGVKT